MWRGCRRSGRAGTGAFAPALATCTRPAHLLIQEEGEISSTAELKKSSAVYTLEQLREQRTRIFAHAAEMRRERQLAVAEYAEAAALAEVTAEVDDKLGSEFIQLPSPPGGREVDASRYKYRCGLQANIFVGALHRMSLVLPGTSDSDDDA